MVFSKGVLPAKSITLQWNNIHPRILIQHKLFSKNSKIGHRVGQLGKKE